MHSRFPVFGATFLCAMFAGASDSDANLILNGDFVTASAGGAAVAKELDVVSGTSTYLANWTSTGYNFLFLPGTNAAGGSFSPQYNNYLSLWSSSNGGIANTWNGQGPTGVPPFALLANVSLNMIPEPASALLWGGRGYWGVDCPLSVAADATRDGSKIVSPRQGASNAAEPSKQAGKPPAPVRTPESMIPSSRPAALAA